MLQRDHGTIVQVGSALAHRSIPLQAAYCAAKHAVTGFTESTTVLAILADELVPGIADRYLTTTAHEAQQSEVPADPDRPDNLFAPVPGDFAAHGEFEAIAKRHSVQFWMVRHRAALAALALAAGGTWVALRRAAPRAGAGASAS
jgi:NAD(P)-dependent dehydrogenase (short-subunit alcohol dehydrogenase family)